MGLKEMLSLAQNLGGLMLAVFYVAMIFWTYKDARRRIDDPILVATAVATSMLPIVGVLVYLLLRPPEYLADVRERELEIRAMERALGRQERCPYCRSNIEAEYLACPVCQGKLREPCRRCEKPLDPRWKLCPFCEAPTPRAQSMEIVNDVERGTRARQQQQRRPAQAPRGERPPSPYRQPPGGQPPQSERPRRPDPGHDPKATAVPTTPPVRPRVDLDTEPGARGRTHATTVPPRPPVRD